MPQARIEVNAVPGSNEGLALSTPVQLSNVDLGDETSYLWSLIDRPEGSAAALSAIGIENPTINLDCEGTYVVQLVVDNGLPTQATDVQILAVRELKQPDLRVPGATETTQVDAIKGWALRVNKDLREFLNRTADPGTFVGRNNSGGDLHRGEVVRVNATTTLKSGLPGQEDVPDFTLALATVDLSDVPLYVVERGVNGATTIANTALVRVRALGQFTAATGAGAVLNQRVWVSDAGILALTPGTFPKQVGIVQEAHAGDFDVQFHGGGGLGSGWEKTGNTIIVDSVFGDDALGQRQGHPFKTPGAALAVALSGDRVYVRFGLYTLTTPLVVPAGVTLQGDFLARTVLYLPNVTADTTLVTLNAGSTLKGVQVYLTSAQHHTLVGVKRTWAGGSAYSILEDVSVLVDNSGAGGGASNVYAIHYTGAGTALGDYNRIGINVDARVLSTGNGDKRGLLVDGGCDFLGTECIFTAAGGAVSNVGVETNHATSYVDLWGGLLEGATADYLETLGDVRLHGVFLATTDEFAEERVRNPVGTQDAVNARTWCGRQAFVVDPVHGDDLLGTREGSPYATLQAALADPGLASGDVVHLTAGSHVVTGNIPIPSGVTIRGAGVESTNVYITDPNTPDFVLFTMGTYSVLEDLTVTINSTVNQNYVCVEFPNVTAETAVCRHTRIRALKDMLVGASTVIGVRHSGVASPAVEHFALDQCEVYAYEHGGGTAIGLYGNTAGTLRARNTTFFAESTGADTCYGVQSNHANAILDLHGCTARGLSGGGVQADVQETLGRIAYRPLFHGTTGALCVEDPVEPTAAMNTRTWCGGDTLVVDPVYGWSVADGAAREGPPFLSLGEALAAAQAGDTILLRPGQHTVPTGFTMPAGVAMVGAGRDISVVLLTAPDADTTLCTMAGLSAISNLTLYLFATHHRTYKGVVFPGTTGTTAWLDGVSVTVDNSTAGAGASNVYGIHHSGTGVPSEHVAVRNSRVQVHSVGTGNKRALLADGGGGGVATLLLQNTNLKAYGGAGSRVAVETNHANNSVGMTGGRAEGESSDLLRTLGEINLQGAVIVSGTAGNLGFTGTPVTLLQWTAAGALPVGVSSFLRTLPYIGAGIPVEDDTCDLYARRGGVAIRMTVRAVTGPGGAITDTFTLYVNGVATGLVCSLTGATTSATAVAVSGNISPGSQLSVVAVVGALSTLADVAVEVDVYWG